MAFSKRLDFAQDFWKTLQFDKQNVSNKVSEILMLQESPTISGDDVCVSNAETLFSAVIPPLNGEFLYRAKSGAVAPYVGMRIELPFGRRVTTGFVVSVGTDRECKALESMQARKISPKVVSIEDGTPGFSIEQLVLFEWMTKYHGEPLSKILDLAVPILAAGRSDPLYELNEGVGPSPTGKLQRLIIDYVSTAGGSMHASEIRAAYPNASAAISSLKKRGFLTEKNDSDTKANNQFVANAPADLLNDAQMSSGEEIASAVTKAKFISFLLHGVTGSGKTEVYMHAIRSALRAGRGSLVIVPEIALTPQLVERFERKVGAPIAVLHSNLKPRQRWLNWSRLLSGEVAIALGARSAIFAPVRNLGLIVVDEEHDSSFKQGEGIRYHARDLALVRGKMAQCPVVLGSATPSLETFHHALQKRHIYLQLANKFHEGKKLKYTLIDLNKMKPWEMPSKNVSHELRRLIHDTVERGEQVFVLYNRRGFASYLQCGHCEHVVKCPHCSVTLTYHQRPVSLLCHFCGFSSAPLLVCPACQRSDAPERKSGDSPDTPFILRGGGTERISDELRALFPKARLGQLDRDTAQSVADYTEILGKVRDRSIDILVGTQMIAKGHDLPDVTLVGVVDCDVGLHMPDFRASERIYQLLTQVAGRAGRRAKQGHVALQTRLPTHPSIVNTIKEDYNSFALHELEERRQLGNPPFQRLLRVVVAAEDRAMAQTAAHLLAQIAHPLSIHYGVTILGPVAAPLEKVRRHWRFHLIAKSHSAPTLQAFMISVRNALDLRKEIRVIYDMDPQDVM